MTVAPTASDAAPDAGPDVVRLGTAGRSVRVGVTLAAVALLLTGTFFHRDDAFPFGPFSMYARASATDGMVRSARVEAVDEDGRRFKLTDSSTGLRRAEIEGQMSRFRDDPTRLRHVAEAYQARHPDAPRLVLVEVLQRRYHLVDGDPSGEVTEVQSAAWAAPGHEGLADYDARIAAEEAEEAERTAEAAGG